MMDLIRTCILSRKWRYTWCSVLELTFNQKFLDDLKEGSGSQLPQSVVDHVFLLRKAPVRRFHLSDFSNACNAHVDKWIIYLTRNGIEELCLQLQQDGPKFYMASCLLSCKQLKVLVLCCYKLVVPHTFKDFSNLIDIDLKVHSASKRSIVDLVSYCPRLETLKLEYNNKVTNLKIDAVKLKYLRVRGSLDNIYLGGCSKLTHCEIYLVGGSGVEDEFVNVNNLEKVLGCLPLLKELTVEDSFLQLLSKGPALQRLVYGFEHLMFLRLNVNFQDSKEISTAVSIFRSSPRLETIEILPFWEDQIISSDPSNWVDNDCVF